MYTVLKFSNLFCVNSIMISTEPEWEKQYFLMHYVDTEYITLAKENRLPRQDFRVSQG